MQDYLTPETKQERHGENLGLPLPDPENAEVQRLIQDSLVREIGSSRLRQVDALNNRR